MGIGIGIGVGIGGTLQSILKFLRMLFVSEDATSATFSYTAIEAAPTESGVVEYSNSATAIFPAVAVVSQDATSITIETGAL